MWHNLSNHLWCPMTDAAGCPNSWCLSWQDRKNGWLNHTRLVVSESTKIQPKSLKVEITNLLGFAYNKYETNYFLRLSCRHLQKNINTKQLSFEKHPV